MLFDDLLTPFLQHRPSAVMLRACLEHAFAAADLDDLFRREATAQYEREVLFSRLVALLGAVVTRRYPSVHAAYRADPAAVGASLASVYDKLNHTEPGIAEALVRHTAARLGAVMGEWPAHRSPLAEWPVRVVDGNYLAGTDHRLGVLRGHGAAALPGMAVVVQDHRTGLLTDLIAVEDGYANERSLIDRLVTRIGAGEVVVGDRNFCTRGLFAGLAGRRAYFVVRHHAGLPLDPVGERRPVGVTGTGAVFEQDVRVGAATYRLIAVALTHPTRDGEAEIRVLTNLPADRAPGVAVAEAYRVRWTLEATFLEVTRSVQGELSTLGYPRAALLTFALALAACNAVRVVVRALDVAHRAAHPEESASSYYVVNELAAAYDGMAVVVPSSCWAVVRGWTGRELAAWLVVVAGTADWRRYRKTGRGPKKPAANAVAGRRAPHRSTYRLLNPPPIPAKPPARP